MTTVTKLYARYRAAFDAIKGDHTPEDTALERQMTEAFNRLLDTPCAGRDEGLIKLEIVEEITVRDNSVYTPEVMKKLLDDIRRTILASAGPVTGPINEMEDPLVELRNITHALTLVGMTLGTENDRDGMVIIWLARQIASEVDRLDEVYKACWTAPDAPEPPRLVPGDS